MRGRIKNPKTIIVSGVIYLEIEDEEQIIQAQNGDIVLCIDVEGPYHNTGNYRVSGYKGCFRLGIFDGKSWFHLSPIEFFENRENHFSKNERPYDCFSYCKELLAKLAGTILYKSYRDHYTREEYHPNDFKGKKGNKFKKPTKNDEK